MIAAAGRLSDSDGLAVVVTMQAVAWVLVGLFVALWVYRVGGSLLIGALTGCLYYTLGESFFNVRLIYAETITVALAVAAGFALSVSMLGGSCAWTWRWLAGALALGTAHARPIYQLLLPVYAAFAVAPHVRRLRAVRYAMPFVVAGLIGLLPFYLVHAFVSGSPTFVSGAGYSLPNYLGDRRLLGKFPPGFEAIETLYSIRFGANPDKTHIGWWEVADDWVRTVGARTGREPSSRMLDRVMGATAVAVLSRNPDYYVRRWHETWREFSTSSSPSVSSRWCPINLASSGWAFYWAYLGAWSPFAILAVEFANAARNGRRPDRAARPDCHVPGGRAGEHRHRAVAGSGALSVAGGGIPDHCPGLASDPDLGLGAPGKRAMEDSP